MLRGFIEWPQLASATGTPKAAAICSRSCGLGVQRPSAIAATRSTGSRMTSLADYTGATSELMDAYFGHDHAGRLVGLTWRDDRGDGYGGYGHSEDGYDGNWEDFAYTNDDDSRVT